MRRAIATLSATIALSALAVGGAGAAQAHDAPATFTVAGSCSWC